MSVGRLESVNLGRPMPSVTKSVQPTGIGKVAVKGPVEARDPGPRKGGLGSGLVGDFIGDARHHGGAEQAIYAFAREDLDDWQIRLNRDLPNGFFGENLTTSGLDVAGALIGERWAVGDGVLLQVTSPRIPCSTFRGWVGETGWLKMFTKVARPGAYLSVLVPGMIQGGDAVELVHRPDHEVTISLVYRAMMNEPELLPQLAPAADDLPAAIRELIPDHANR